MKKYWKGIEELIESYENNPDNGTEHGPPARINLQPNGTNRRDFLKTFGFAIAGTAIAASCERPVTKAIPYLIKPSEITPGKANYYASTFYDGEAYSSILVKVRDGRPIKIEGNALSSLSNGSTTAGVQGTVLELYDETRYRGPVQDGSLSDWTVVDALISKKIAESDGQVVLVSGGVISPSTRKVIEDFTARSSRFEHLVYDPVSHAAIREANRLSFGRAVIPDYRFDRAGLILSVGADFLGTWLSPHENMIRYANGRRPTEDAPEMSRHIQIESGMTLTGSNADERHTVRPSEQKAVLIHLLAELMNLDGIDPGDVSLHISPLDVKELAAELMAHRDRALVVCGSNDPELQVVVNGINTILGSYGNTIDMALPLETIQGDDAAFASLVDRMNNGSVSSVIFYNANPAYDYHDQEAFRSGLDQVELSVSLSCIPDETSERCDVVCPDHHFLESWNDAMPKPGYYSLGQPAIRNIFDTRQAQESLLTWMGEPVPFDDYIRAYWEEHIYSLSDRQAGFTAFWNKCLHDGVFEFPVTGSRTADMDFDLLQPILRSEPEFTDGRMELELYVPVNTGTGKHANNPWLQETPDPVSKITWDNYASVSPAFAEEHHLKTGDVILIEDSLELPVLVQPGQNSGTFSVALGYGKTTGGKAALGTGSNAYGMVTMAGGFRRYHRRVNWEKTGGFYPLATTQSHHSMEGRALIRETTLDHYSEHPASGNELHEEIAHHLDTLYEGHEYKGHHWGMTVDLSSCLGCNACVVGCTAENNVPVVGKEEVMRSHEMHWIRIDRYYSGDPDNPRVARQPVMCQHCDNAPCENVCPVVATTQSQEGINQMIYNRCIGTRYCNNNCPYKVRRFNWLDYTKADALPKNTRDPLDLTLDLPRMVLNPDVTIRAKGVMEKCSLCIQRIQDKKLQAKLENRPLSDGDVKTACQQACPAQAITFGDLNDPDSRVSKNLKDPRTYQLLEELHTLPVVSYKTKIRNSKYEA